MSLRDEEDAARRDLERLARTLDAILVFMLVAFIALIVAFCYA